MPPIPKAPQTPFQQRPLEQTKSKPVAAWSIILMICGFAVASTSWARPNLESRVTDSQLSTTGVSVASMPGASAIQDWVAQDSLNVLVEVAEQGVYRLTFTQACYNLRWATNIGLSGSQNKVWAGFDYLTADGQRCSIGTINRLVDTL